MNGLKSSNPNLLNNNSKQNGLSASGSISKLIFTGGLKHRLCEFTPDSCTSRRLSYATIAGFPLRSNKALNGEAIVNYYEPLIIQSAKDGQAQLEVPAESGEMKASGSPFGVKINE